MVFGTNVGKTFLSKRKHSVAYIFVFKASKTHLDGLLAFLYVERDKDFNTLISSALRRILYACEFSCLELIKIFVITCILMSSKDWLEVFTQISEYFHLEFH